MSASEILKTRLAEKRAAEGKPAEPKSRPKRVERTNDDDEPNVFALARTVDTATVLGRLGIAHDEKFATCPGCGEEGAKIGNNGGLICLHDRCAHAGPPSGENPGFRSTIDMVMEAEHLDNTEAAKRICEWGGIKVPERKTKANGASVEDPHAGSPDVPPDTPPENVNHGTQGGEGRSPAESSALESHWIDLGSRLEWLTERPPEQTWLFKQWRDGRDRGVFPRGRTGVLNATGGIGKTYLVTQTAIAVASGGFLLETLRSVEAGHVLLALAEEDADEARRRINRTVNAAGFDDEQKRTLAERLHVLPLAGVQVALMCSPTLGVIITSDFAVALRNKLNGFGVDWSLIVLDPLVRWAADGVEQNNSIATRFVQILETLTTVRGNPSVLAAHHSSLDSVQNGKSRGRGVTAIRDAFRWEVSMDGIESPDGQVEGVILRNSKSNYSLKFKPMALVRNTEPGIEGTLRLATDAEQEALKLALPKERQTAAEREQAKQASNRGEFEQRQETVAAVLPTEPAHFSRDDLAAALQAKGHSWSFDTIRALMSALILAGRARDLSDGKRTSTRQWCLVERDS